MKFKMGLREFEDELHQGYERHSKVKSGTKSRS